MSTNEQRTEVTDIQELNNRFWNNIDNLEAVKKLLQQEKKLAHGEAPASAWWGWANWSFLAYAVYKGNDKLVKLLLDNGAEPNQEILNGNWKGYTLIAYTMCKDFYSCDKNWRTIWTSIFTSLISNGANLNQVIPENYAGLTAGKSLLENSVIRSDFTVTKSLLEHKADPDYKLDSKNLMKIILLAGKKNTLDEAEKSVIQLLKMTFNNYSITELQDLLQIAACGPRENYTYIASYGYGDFGGTAIVTDFDDEVSYVSIVSVLRTHDQANLLNANRPIIEGRFKDWSLLAFAVYFNRTELAEELLLMHAEPNQSFDHVAPLITSKTNWIGNWIGWTLLAFSVFNNRPKMVEVLLKYGATPTGKITQGKEFKEWSLVSFAIYKRYTEVAQLLLQYHAITTTAEADACFIDYDKQWTLLAWAVYYNQVNVAQSLVEYGADPEQKFRAGSYQGYELYDYALSYKQKEITMILAAAVAIRNEKKKSLEKAQEQSNIIYELDKQLEEKGKQLEEKDKQLKENDKEITSLKWRITQLEASNQTNGGNSDSATKQQERKELEELKEKLAKAIAETDKLRQDTGKWKQDFEALNKQYLQAKIKNTNFKEQVTPPSTTQSAQKSSSVGAPAYNQSSPTSSYQASSSFAATSSTKSTTTTSTSQNIGNNRSGMFANQVNSSTAASTTNQTNSANEVKKSKEEKATSAPTSTSKQNSTKSQTSQSESQEKKEICVAYLYEDSEMKRILEHEVKAHNNRSAQSSGLKGVTVLGPLDHNYGIVDALAAYDRNGKKPGIILIPYNLNRLHWIGILIEYDAKKIIRADYYDSSRWPIPPVLNAELKLASKSTEVVTAFTIIAPEAGLITQFNATDCGPCTIENLLAGIGYKEAKETDSIGRRLRHLRVLEQAGDTDFYAGFYQRQRENRSSFSMMSGACHTKLVSSNAEYNFSKSEYKWLLTLALDIIKLPSTIKLELFAALQPGNSHEPEEHASQIDRIRVALNSGFTNSAVRVVINKFFLIKPKATSLEQALLRLNYNYIEPLSVLTSLSQTAINDDLVALEDNCSKTYTSPKC